ncbi:MAG TPA: hypothetical protein VGL56_21030 [Fimbriimonadaceae bacterium]
MAENKIRKHTSGKNPEDLISSDSHRKEVLAHIEAEIVAQLIKTGAFTTFLSAIEHHCSGFLQKNIPKLI